MFILIIKKSISSILCFIHKNKTFRNLTQKSLLMSETDEETNSFGANWPSASHIEEWERQWQTNGNSQQQQQQMEKATTSSAENHNEASNENLEEGDESTDEIEIVENEREKDVTTTSNGIYDAKEPPIEKLIHTRELLQEVICPWENVQQFVKISEENFSTFKCLVAFRMGKKGNCEEDNTAIDLYIDQITELKKDRITFKHLGSFELDLIKSYYGTIQDEDYGKWLDLLIKFDEKLPRTNLMMQKKRRAKKALDQAISLSIFRRHLLPNPLKFFDGIVGEQPPIMPLFVDISSIILQIKDSKKLLKLCQSEFVNILTGLCIQVDITQIKHSLKLPPLMTLLKHMLIPISFVTLDSPTYHILEMHPFLSNVILNSSNENGDLLCSSQLPQQQLFPSEQLIQISLFIWAMNNIPIPTLEDIQNKAAQFRNALMRCENIQLVPVRKKSNILPLGQISLQEMNQLEQEEMPNNNQIKKKKKGKNINGCVKRKRKRLAEIAAAETIKNNNRESNAAILPQTNDGAAILPQSTEDGENNNTNAKWPPPSMKKVPIGNGQILYFYVGQQN